jgi:hypothetical protein
MADRDPGYLHWEAAQRNQERHESYLLTLTFTLLALAVQSASFGSQFWQNNVELLGWASLMISGLSGLSRGEWLPLLFGHFSRQSDAEHNVRAVRQAKRQGITRIQVVEEGRVYPIDEHLARVEADASSITKKAEELQSRTQLKYKVQRGCFAIGLLCLAVSRGWPALSAIAERVRSFF